MIETSPRRTALDWYATMPAPSLSAQDDVGHLSVRRYTGTSAEMRQPGLDDNILCIHLGGPKIVRRWRGGSSTEYDVAPGALTILPAHQANRWLTRGPIDFAHLTLTAAFIHQVIAEEFGAGRTSLELIDRVGFRDPYLEMLFRDLLVTSASRANGRRLHRDSLMVVLAATLVGHHSSASARMKASVLAPKGGLPGWRLRRVTDYMAANLAEDIGLGDLTLVAGLSRAQFFRAFRQSTGLSPHRYLSAMRIDRARLLLDETSLSVEAVAMAVGQRAGARFSARFEQRFGVPPRLYRRSMD